MKGHFNIKTFQHSADSHQKEMTSMFEWLKVKDENLTFQHLSNNKP